MRRTGGTPTSPVGWTWGNSSTSCPSSSTAGWRRSMRSPTRSVFRTMSGTLGRNLILATRSNEMAARNPLGMTGHIYGSKGSTLVRNWRDSRRTTSWASSLPTVTSLSLSLYRTIRTCVRSLVGSIFPGGASSSPSPERMAFAITSTRRSQETELTTTLAALELGRYVRRRLLTGRISEMPGALSSTSTRRPSSPKPMPSTKPD